MIAKCLNPRCYDLYKAEKLGVTPCPRCGSTEAAEGDAKARMIRMAMLGSKMRERSDQS